MKSGITIREVFALKFETNSVLQRRQLLAVAKLSGFSNAALDAGPVQYYRLRQDPVPWVRQAKNGRLFRRPKTGKERRAHFSSEAAQEVLETHGIDLKERRKRNARRLPTSWDDISRSRIRNWKKYRGTHRRNAGGIDRRIHSCPF